MADEFHRAVESLAPHFSEELSFAKAAQLHLSGAIIMAGDLPRAARLIGVLAISDVGDLLDEVERGSGRAAMRSARTLIEHAVNIHSVTTNDEAAERYLAHLDQGPILLGDAPGSELLEHKARRSARHAARKAASAARGRWAAAERRYGRSFARQWHSATLYDRAVAAGREDLYDLYRLGSAVIHGSAAGAVGQFYMHDLDIASYAVGRVPALVPLAFLLGVEAYLQSLVFLEASSPGLEVELPGSAINRLLTEHADMVWRASRQVMEGAGTQARVKTFIAFSRRGRTRCYLGSSEHLGQWLPLADDPALDEFIAWLRPVRESYIAQDGPFTEGGWAAIEIPGISFRPDWLKRSIPEGTMPLIVRADDGTWMSGDVADEGLMVNAWVVHEAMSPPRSWA